MSDLEGHRKIEVGTDRGFGIVFAVVFAIIAVWPLTGGNTLRIWALTIALALMTLALIKPSILHPLNILWFKFGMKLGAIVSPIVMSILFFTVVTPTGMIVRFMGKDLLRLKLDKEAKSYWIDRNDEKSPMGSMKNQF